MARITQFILLLTCIGLTLPFKLAAQKINIAAIDWCPQICPTSDSENNYYTAIYSPGFLVEIARAIYPEPQYQLNIQYYPWSRAIKLVNQGKMDVLLSPAKAEAPQLTYPQLEIGTQKMCFFTLASSNWQYTNQESLANMQIGIGSDTSIEELNDYVKKHPEQFQYLPYLERYIKQSIGKLDKKRIDAFLFTQNTTLYEFNKLGVSDKYRTAGCVNTTPIYMAFAPIKTPRIAQLITQFDSQMSQLHKKGLIETIMNRYQLSSWKKNNL